jgi:hypothetical protein
MSDASMTGSNKGMKIFFRMQKLIALFTFMFREILLQSKGFEY